MKAWFWKGMLAAAISFSLLSGSIGKAAQQQQGQEQRGIEGVWDIIVTGVSCATGAPLFTGRVIHMFIDGGTMTEIADRSNRSAGLGTWRHLGGRNYSAVHEFIEYSAFGPNTFNGTAVVAREIELSKNGDEFTATATSKIFDKNDNLINTGCATSTATRFE